MHFDRFCVRRSAFRGRRRQGTGERGERETVVRVWRRYHGHQAWQESTGAHTCVSRRNDGEGGWEDGIVTHFANVGVSFFVTGVPRCLCCSLCHLFPLLLLLFIIMFLHLAGSRQHVSKVNSTRGAAWKCSCMHKCMCAACRERRVCERWTTLKRLCFVRRWKPLSLYKRPFFAGDIMSADSALTPPAPE
jgi:hypothetical protein